MACRPPWVWEQVREEIPLGLGILLHCDFVQKSSRGHASLALENGTDRSHKTCHTALGPAGHPSM